MNQLRSGNVLTPLWLPSLSLPHSQYSTFHSTYIRTAIQMPAPRKQRCWLHTSPSHFDVTPLSMVTLNLRRRASGHRNRQKDHTLSSEKKLYPLKPTTARKTHRCRSCPASRLHLSPEDQNSPDRPAHRNQPNAHVPKYVAHECQNKARPNPSLPHKNCVYRPGGLRADRRRTCVTGNKACLPWSLCNHGTC